jgi:signal peptidase II
MKTKFRVLLFAVLFIGLIGCDRITKIVAKKELQGKGTYSYFHDTVRLMYVENTGAFLSLGANWSDGVSNVVFIGVPLIFLILLAIYVIKNRNNTSLLVYLAMIFILSGGMGNLIDRIFYHRHVTDFLNFGIGNVRTGILNLADTYVTSGVVLLLFFYMTEKKVAAKETAA